MNKCTRKVNLYMTAKYLTFASLQEFCRNGKKEKGGHEKFVHFAGLVHAYIFKTREHEK